MMKCWPLVTIVLCLGGSVRGQDPVPPTPAPALPSAEGGPTEREQALEARLQRLEETNQQLLQSVQLLVEREERNRQEADARYRALEERFRVGATEPRPDTTGTGAIGNGTRGDNGSGASVAGGFNEGTAGESEEGHEPTTPSWPPRGGPGVSLPLSAAFDDGFLLESRDEEISLRLHILDQTDFKDFIPNNQFPARSGLYIPRVRLYFEGDLTRMFNYEVSLQRSVDGEWDLLDGNLDIGSTERFQVSFGRMLVPYSYDWYDHLEQYFLTPERGLFPLNFGLSRSAGLMAHGASSTTGCSTPSAAMTAGWSASPTTTTSTTPWAT